MQWLRSRLQYLAFLLLASLSATAQQNDDAVIDALDSTFQQYAANLQQPDLYLHLDKTIYVHQENIWFTAYLLNNMPVEPQHTLYVLLVEETAKKIRASNRFVLEKGIAGGSLFLPDSLPTGDYRLLAYTNSFLNHPLQPVFQQSLTIRSNESGNFKLSFIPPDAPIAKGDSVHFTYKILTGYGGLASGGDLLYTLSADGIPMQTGKKKINAFGEADFALLKQPVLGKKLTLVATITRQKDQKDKQVIKATVPLFEQAAFLRFFPESGNLVQDHPSRMALEIKNGTGVPIATKGQLLENGAAIATFLTDQYGIGIIDWMPRAGKNYTVTIDDSTRQLVYSLPPIANNGYSLRVPVSVVDDTSFLVEIYAPDKGFCNLIAHNYRTAFFTGRLLMNNKGSSLRLSTADMPEGVVTITVFDTKGVPQAERAVYIKKKSGLRVTMVTDSAAYHHRSKLQLKIKVTDSEGKPVRSLFSLACVLATRLDSIRAGDIVRYYHFDRFLPKVAAMPASQYLENAVNIERILLTRFWTRYKWEEISATPPYTATVQKDCDAGDVYLRDRKSKKPVDIMIMSGKNIYSMATDAAGHFELPAEALRMNDGEKATIAVVKSSSAQDYTLTLYNKCAAVDTALAGVWYPDAGFPKAELSVQEQQYLKKAMKAVVVTAKKYDNFAAGVFQSTNCNDWICMYNILNCPNHPSGIRPVDGGVYTYHGQQVTYHACKGGEQDASYVKQVKGTYYPKEFYVADYEKFNPTEPETMTTVFWNYAILTDEQGEATIHFSTNDLNGRFACVLQGYTTAGAISAKTFFKVIE
jgi:hypothetical protein